jgi:hypothetical protein
MNRFSSLYRARTSRRNARYPAECQASNILRETAIRRRPRIPASYYASFETRTNNFALTQLLLTRDSFAPLVAKPQRTVYQTQRMQCNACKQGARCSLSRLQVIIY